jgi:hypothetical protein
MRPGTHCHAQPTLLSFTRPSHWKTSRSHGSGCPDLIQVSRDLKMTYQTKSDLPSLERLENDLSNKIRPHPSLERLENDFSNKIRPSKSWETWPSCQCKNQLALRIVTGGYTSRAYVDAVQVAVSLFYWSYSKLARSIPRDFLRILFVSSHLV